MPLVCRFSVGVMDVHADISLKAEELRLALQAKLRVRGRNFGRAVERAGRLLPRRLHKQAAVIVKAQGLGGHPKLVRMIDQAAVTKAFADFTDFLEAIDPKERRRARFLGWLGGLAFNLLVVATCFVIWLVWSGHL